MKTHRIAVQGIAAVLLFSLLMTSGCGISNVHIIEKKRVELGVDGQYKTECYKIMYGSDGLRVAGYLIQPSAKDRKYPVLIYNRGGNRDYGKLNEAFLKYLSYIAGTRGYIILASQYRGVDGGEGLEEFGGKDINDVLNLIPIAEKLSNAEPEKIVMWGMSRGGMMTYLAVKNAAKIKSAAVVAGPTDIAKSYYESDQVMKGDLEVLIGGKPDTKKAAYNERSAIYWPEKINVPIIILHGEKVDEAKNLAEKLRKLGKVHELVIYPEMGHEMGKNFEDIENRIFDWFGNYLNQE